MKSVELSPVVVNERITDSLRPASREVGAASPIAAADSSEHQSYIYFPELKTKFQLTDIDLKETRRRSQWLVLNTYARVLRRLARYLGTPTIKADTRDEPWNEVTNTWWCEDYLDLTGNYDVFGKYNANMPSTAVSASPFAGAGVCSSSANVKPPFPPPLTPPPADASASRQCAHVGPTQAVARQKRQAGSDTAE